MNLMTRVMRKDGVCVREREICANALLLILNYICISKHSVVCINLCQPWFLKASRHWSQIDSRRTNRKASTSKCGERPLTTRLNEERHLKGTFRNTKGQQLNQLSAVSSNFYLYHKLLKRYGFFHLVSSRASGRQSGQSDPKSSTNN